MGRVFLPHMDAFFRIWVDFSWRIVGSDFHHSGGEIGADAGQTVGAADYGVAAVDVGPAVFAAEDCPLGEGGKAVQTGGASGSYHGVGQDLIVESDVDTEVVPVKGHRFHINICVQQFGTADPGVGAGVQNGLGTGG